MLSHQRASLSLSTSFFISTCILKFLINDEIFKSIALAVLEIVKTQYVALEVSLSIMYVSREATFALVQV